VTSDVIDDVITAMTDDWRQRILQIRPASRVRMRALDV